MGMKQQTSASEASTVVVRLGVAFFPPSPSPPEGGREGNRREICVSKSIRLACRRKEIYHFCNVLLCIQGQIRSTSSPGAYIRRGYLTKGCLRYDLGGGAHIWRGFYIKGGHRGAYFRNFKVCWIKSKLLTPTL